MAVPFRDWFALALLFSLTFLVYFGKIPTSVYTGIVGTLAGFFFGGVYASRVERAQKGVEKDVQ